MSPLLDAPADPLEGKARHVIPVPPDEECLAADVVVRHETPVSAVFAVVAIVAHHEVVARRYLAGESRLIVYAVFAARKRPHAAHAHRRRVVQVRDIVRDVAELLLEPLRG